MKTLPKRTARVTREVASVLYLHCKITIIKVCSIAHSSQTSWLERATCKFAPIFCVTFGFPLMPSASEEVQQICLELTPPHLLSLLDSWWYPQGDSEGHRSEAAHKVRVIRQWVDETVPSLLRRLHEIISRHPWHEFSLEVRASIVVAASVYISPTRDAGGSKASHVSREPWITTDNSKLANFILQEVDADKDDGADFELIQYILVSYLKPLFSSSTPSSINANTGRAAPAISNLSGSATSSSRGNLMDDEVMWKGGDVERSKAISIIGQKVIFTIASGDPVLRSRHRAIGCFNVFFFCCKSLTHQRPSNWERVWPSVLPPLLTLLEDSAPLYRLIGSRILSTMMLGSPTIMGTLLLRTGVEPLLRERLESNLTYINTTLSAALLQSSSEALHLLTQATTSEMRLGYPSPLNAIQDGGKLRYNQLSKIIDEGVLRVWAYASASMPDGEEGTLLPVSPGIDAKEMTRYDKEASDTINASIEILIRMTRDDALGIGIARYLDVMLEFLTAQLLGLETRLSRHSLEEQKEISLDREICCARAIEALLSSCRKAPGVRTWSARCLTTVARTWVSLEHQQKRKQAQLLRASLQSILQMLSLAEPVLFKDLSERLLKVDSGAISTLMTFQ